MRIELQTLLTAIHGMSLEDLLDLLGQLETIRATAKLKMVAGLPQSDKRIDVKETARRLGVSADYVYRHAEKFPFTCREGGKLLFSDRGIDAYIARRRR